jgi:hypothetical protein
MKARRPKAAGKDYFQDSWNRLTTAIIPDERVPVMATLAGVPGILIGLVVPVMAVPAGGVPAIPPCGVVPVMAVGAAPGVVV